MVIRGKWLLNLAERRFVFLEPEWYADHKGAAYARLGYYLYFAIQLSNSVFYQVEPYTRTAFVIT